MAQKRALTQLRDFGDKLGHNNFGSLRGQNDSTYRGSTAVTCILESVFCPVPAGTPVSK